MRCLNRNKTTFWYSLYSGRSRIKDESGNFTGEYENTYSKPIECKANISPASGAAYARQFGRELVYDKVIVLADTSIPLDEHSILWIDQKPEFDKFGELAEHDDGRIATPHDYIVKRVARSLNAVSIAVSKVDVSG